MHVCSPCVCEQMSVNECCPYEDKGVCVYAVINTATQLLVTLLMAIMGHVCEHQSCNDKEKFPVNVLAFRNVRQTRYEHV